MKSTRLTREVTKDVKEKSPAMVMMSLVKTFAGWISFSIRAARAGLSWKKVSTEPPWV